jgi:hypothetical protein
MGCKMLITGYDNGHASTGKNRTGASGFGPRGVVVLKSLGLVVEITGCMINIRLAGLCTLLATGSGVDQHSQADGKDDRRTARRNACAYSVS